MDKKDVQELLNRHVDEVGPLAKAFRAVGEHGDQDSKEKVNREWLAVVQCDVSLSAWVDDDDCISRIDPSRGASMRFLSTDSPGEDEAAANAYLESRQRLLEGLLAEIDDHQTRTAYAGMLKWLSYIESGNPHTAHFPLSSDTAFGYNLLILDQMLSDAVREGEQEWRKNNPLPDDVATPGEVTVRCSHAALQSICHWLDQERESDKRIASAPTSLIAVTSANVSANKCLLEFAAKDARGLEAEAMCVEIVQQLNRKGITEVPLVERSDSLESEHRFRELLTAWFGYHGTMIEKDGFFKRHMTDTDVIAISIWAKELQKRYIRGRGSNGPNGVPQAAHGGQLNHFIFALTMVGAFYCKTRTAREFAVHSNATYAVFPSKRDMKSKGLTSKDSPTAEPRVRIPEHAAQVLSQSYGLMFFSVHDWHLNDRHIRDAAKTARIKRAHHQHLLEYAVKGRSSAELLSLHNTLDSLLIDKSDQAA
ncbi:hypothetical protein [Caballeronia sp. NK8]|uniref:hypothetical protein n=1 Tax=Caballeronia sp. NK8 TaxID=140098 RepID=UPI001BCE9509|nr:hypothetical protein [Caballeronia sp. NK8]